MVLTQHKNFVSWSSWFHLFWLKFTIWFYIILQFLISKKSGELSFFGSTFSKGSCFLLLICLPDRITAPKNQIDLVPLFWFRSHDRRNSLLKKCNKFGRAARVSGFTASGGKKMNTKVNLPVCGRSPLQSKFWCHGSWKFKKKQNIRSGKWSLFCPGGFISDLKSNARVFLS